MKGDFTRNTFRKEDHYSRVLQQQGRVQLDADWNELNDIFLHRSRTTRYDVIGPACGPENDAGFEITAAGDRLFIGTGRYYVNGIFVELDSEEGQAVNFLEQIDSPTAVLPTTPGRYRAILDVWERHITALEEPYIREVALGGPDTATRTRIMAQVRLIPAVQDEACDDFVPGPSPAEADARGMLSVRSTIADESPNPCQVPPSAGYRRLENQLYRVDIHDGGAVGTATFKWSRENGAVISQIESRDGDNLVVATPGRDENLGFKGTDWIEITDDHQEMAGEAGVLVQLTSAVGKVLTVDPSTFDGASTLAVAVDSLDAASRKVRRWESPATPITTGSFIALEDGVEIQFEPPGDGFRSGDYWIIPARTNTGDVEWPKDDQNTPIPQPPRGIDHYLAPLALLTLVPGGNWTDIVDCRCLFPPLSDLPDQAGCCCCTVTVGDGSYSTGAFTDIQQAIDAVLEETAGKRPLEVCLLPGVYRLKETLRIENARLKIKGCGEQTQIIGPPGRPVLLADRCDITLEALAIRATAPEGAVILTRCQSSEILDCVIHNEGTPPAGGDAPPVEIERIDRPFISPRSKNAGSEIDAYERELIGRRISRYLPVEKAVRPSAVAYAPAVAIRETKGIAIHDNHLSGYPSVALQAKDGHVNRNRMTDGGLWIQDGTAFIKVEENQILKGYGPGVLLGGVRQAEHLASTSAGVETVSIARNQILLMGDSGIASATEIDGIAGLGDLEDIRITGNHIEGCGERPLADLDGEGVGGIVLKNGSQIRIADNVIRHNGSQRQTACGILVEDCEEVSILDNAVEENGASETTAVVCIDFRDRKEAKGETPLEEKTARFENHKEEDGARWRIESNVMGIEQGAGLRCQPGLRITLAEPTNQLDLQLIGSEALIRVLDAAGKELEKTSNTPENIQVPWTATFRHSGMAVVDIAPAERLWLQQVCIGGVVGYQAGIAALFVYGDDFRPPQDNSPFYTHEPGRSALAVQGNTVVTPAGQALWVVGAGQMIITGNELVSRDEFTQPVPEEASHDKDLDAFWLKVAQVGRCASIINLGIALEFADLLVNAGFAARASSLSSSTLGAAVNFGREVLPGLLQFNDNQVLFYTGAAEKRLVYPSCFVLSFDDVSFQDNQIRSSAENGLQIADAVVVAATTRATNNRFTETFTSAFASLLSFAMMNTTAGNIATHCIFAFAQAGNILNAGNQIAIKQNCGQFGAGVASFVPSMTLMDASDFAFATGGNPKNG